MEIRFRSDFYADVRTEDRFRTTISYRAGELEEYRVRCEVRSFLRVYDGRMWYYASVTDPLRIQETLDGLYATATPNAEILADPIVRRFEVNRASEDRFADCSVREVPTEEKHALLSGLLPLLEEDACMTMPFGLYLDRNSRFSFRSSLGAEVSYTYQTCGVMLGCSMVEGERKHSAYCSRGDVRFDGLRDYGAVLREELREHADFMRNSVAVEAGVYPVVLSPVAAGVFAHESFGHKSESDFMLSDETMREEWQLGMTVGSPILSIVESGELLGSGYVPFDDEGTRARKNYLIKNGVLAGRLHSAATAAALDEDVTGNARAVDGTYEPIVRMTNTYIEGGDLSFDELLAPIKKGYFIKDISHGSGMSTFTLAPTLAYEICDGRLGRPVQISVITGNVFRTLGLIDGLTRDEKQLSFVAGGCGKMEQSGLPVGFGGPYVRVSEMNVQ